MCMVNLSVRMSSFLNSTSMYPVDVLIGILTGLEDDAIITISPHMICCIIILGFHGHLIVFYRMYFFNNLDLLISEFALPICSNFIMKNIEIFQSSTIFLSMMSINRFINSDIIFFKFNRYRL